MPRQMPAASWREFNQRVFQAAGLSEAHAQLAADVRLESALRQGAGIDVVFDQAPAKHVAPPASWRH